MSSFSRDWVTPPGIIFDIIGGVSRHPGHGFAERLSVEELRSVALDLLPKSKVSSWRSRFTLETGLNMVAAASRPLAIGLKHHNGEWLSVIGGWYRPHSAILCFQCNNDRDFGPDSLSVVLRAYLIELLIRQGLEELVIWSGHGPPLSRYVTYRSNDWGTFRCADISVALCP